MMIQVQRRTTFPTNCCTPTEEVAIATTQPPAMTCRFQPAAAVRHNLTSYIKQQAYVHNFHYLATIRLLSTQNSYLRWDSVILGYSYINDSELFAIA